MKRSGWSPLKVKVLKCGDPVDIAVLVPAEQLTVDFQLEPSSVGMAVGQDAYFVGFPFAESERYPGNPDVFGLVKRATVAGLVSMPEQHAQKILLDGYNNPGFSGSPVIFRDLSQPEAVYKVAGVLVNFRYEAAPVVKKKKEIRADQITAEDLRKDDVVQTNDGHLYRVETTDELVRLNTGIAMAWDIGSAVELIRRHPVGPKADDAFTGR